MGASFIPLLPPSLFAKSARSLLALLVWAAEALPGAPSGPLRRLHVASRTEVSATGAAEGGGSLRSGAPAHRNHGPSSGRIRGPKQRKSGECLFGRLREQAEAKARGRKTRRLPPLPSQLLGQRIPLSLHSFSCVQASFLGGSHGKGKKPEEASPKSTDGKEMARSGRVSARSEPGKRLLPRLQWLEDAPSDGAQDAVLCVTKASPERHSPTV